MRGLDVSLPLGEFAQLAIEQNDGLKTEKCGTIFPFARIVKAHPDLEGLDGVEAAQKIACAISGHDFLSIPEAEGILDDWFSVELEESPSDPLSDFARMFDAVHSPGGDVVEVARRRALVLPLIPIHQMSVRYASFVSIVGHLQQLAGLNDIIAPVVKMAAVLNVDHSTISSYRAQAIKRGLLTETGGYSKLERIATSFRFAVDCFDWDTGQQIKDPAPTHTRISRNNRITKTIRSTKSPHVSDFAASTLKPAAEVIKNRLNAEMARRAELQRQAEEMQKGHGGPGVQ